jgi:hypothetical protein
VLVAVDFADEAQPLASPVGNARRWSATLQRLGFPRHHQRLLLSPAAGNEQPLPRGARPAEAARIRDEVVSLAHTLRRRGGRGVLYLATHGQVRGEQVLLRSADGLDLPLAEVLAPFAASRGGWHLTVVLECCHTAELDAVSRALVDASDGRILVVAGGRGPVHEAWIGGEWTGLFTWAATASLDAAPRACHADGAHLALSAGELAARCEALTATLGSPQVPRIHPTTATDRPLLGPPPEAPQWQEVAGLVLRAAQLSGGTNGYRIYELTVGTTLVGRVYATSNSNVPSPLAKDQEYWDVDLSALQGNDFAMELTADGVTTAPTASALGTRWRVDNAASVDTSPFNGTVAGSSLTFECTTNGSTLPWLRLQPTSPKRTHWVRPDATRVFQGASVGATLDFAHSSSDLDASGLDALLTRDDWQAW